MVRGGRQLLGRPLTERCGRMMTRAIYTAEGDWEEKDEEEGGV